MPEKDSHILIKEAKEYFDEQLNDIVQENPKKWSEVFSNISRFLKSHARIVSVYAATDADAFIIFETLNDRGADLTIADLLKNYLFSKSGAEIDTVQNNWIEAFAILEEYQPSDQFITFLRHYWSSMNGMTRERDLYRSIKATISTRTAALKLSNELRIAAKLYGAALSAESDFWIGYSERTKNVIRLFPRLKLEQNRPLILAILQQFDKKEIEGTLVLLLGWSVRGLVGGVMGKGSAEAAFCDAATKIRNGTIKDRHKLKEALAKLVPGDTSFQSSMSSFRTTNSAFARYILLAIERSMNPHNQPEFIPNEDVDYVNLEHILPQRAKPEQWPQFQSDEVGFFASRIGNMTLLQKGKNNKIGNKPWRVKKPIISESNYQLNKEVGNFEEWDRDTIDNRSETLAALVPAIWPF